MNHNKNYFLFYVDNYTTNDGQSLVRKDMSLRFILGHLYDKYNAFSIKLEGFLCRAANTVVVEDDFVLLHLEGLPFINGYDTCPKFNNSRVLEMIDYAGGGNGYNFISNCNAVNFWKPSTEKFDFRLFHTRVSDETKLIVNDNVCFIFSITGIDKFKVIHPIKDVIVPRLQSKKTYNLILSTHKAVVVGTRNRAYRFNNVNLRQIIGSDYDKYKKFALITRQYVMLEVGTSYTQTFSGFLMGNVLISGFNWYRPSIVQDPPLGTQAQTTEINGIHTSPACVACQVVYNSGNNLNRVYKETYIENVFEKSKETIDITISNTQIYNYSLVPFNQFNADLFPHYALNFEIIPLVD